MRINKQETGKRLRKLRKDNNLTLAEVASRCEVSGKPTVNAWENGRAYPKKHIDELAKMYGATVDYLNYGNLGGKNMEFDTVKEALEWLIEVNSGKLKVNGEEATVEKLQEVNRETIYGICDLLGLSDLYLD